MFAEDFFSFLSSPAFPFSELVCPRRMFALESSHALIPFNWLLTVIDEVLRSASFADSERYENVRFIEFRLWVALSRRKWLVTWFNLRFSQIKSGRLAVVIFSLFFSQFKQFSSPLYEELPRKTWKLNFRRFLSPKISFPTCRPTFGRKIRGIVLRLVAAEGCAFPAAIEVANGTLWNTELQSSTSTSC